jgi:hypothetical protein
MKRWMKRNIIIFTMNWLANSYKLLVSLICLSLFITSCKKEGDFNLGGAPASTLGMTFTDTLKLVNETILLNDSIISAKPSYLTFGGYSDPGSLGTTFEEAYVSLTLLKGNVDYSGTTVDSAILYLSYNYAYGDTLTGQDFSVHQITTQLDGSVPYQTATSFVSYDPTVVGSKANVTPRAYNAPTMRIPLTTAFASTLLSTADNRNNVDFNSNFYGIVIKANNNSAKCVIRANYTYVDQSFFQTAYTRLTVYFKRGLVKDSSVFMLTSGTAAFNKVISDRSGTPISSIVTNGDHMSDAALNNKCYVQAGTGLATKVTIPNLSKLATIDGSSVIINKATLVMPLDKTSMVNRYGGITGISLLELNPDNSYKYRHGALSYVQSNTTNGSGYYYNQYLGLNLLTHTDYSIDITRYIQSLVSGNYINDGFIITPYLNSYDANGVVLNSFNAVKDKMRLEVYYTKVK